MVSQGSLTCVRGKGLCSLKATYVVYGKGIWIGRNGDMSDYLLFGVKVNRQRLVHFKSMKRKHSCTVIRKSTEEKNHLIRPLFLVS